MFIKIKPLGCVALILGIIGLMAGMYFVLKGQPDTSPTVAQGGISPAVNPTPPALKDPTFPTPEPFTTVPADDSRVTSALDVKAMEEAKKLYGKEGTFVGTVVKVFKPTSGTVQVLNFAEDYKTTVVGAVKEENLPKFPELETLIGKKVLITGEVFEYQNRPEVDLTDPTGIQVVE
jgi:DNA/RNA endonuclease YhcR with UshA esterase domain